MNPLSGRWTKTRLALHDLSIRFVPFSIRRPRRMLRNGRPVDKKFGDKDWLYRRCIKEDIAGDVLLPPRIRVDRPSVNWSRYSKPWDVTFDHPKQGIVRFVVGLLPKQL